MILTGSGTQALELAFRKATGSSESNRLLALPAYSCYDVATAAVGANVPIVFYDLDPGTLTPDLEDLRRALTAGAGVVAIASLYGFPVDWDEITGCCRETGAVVIEDAAQGLGSSWRGEEGGTFGDLTVLSFGRGKGWTGGGGGALLIRGDKRTPGEVVEEADPGAGMGSGLRAGVLSVAQWALGRPGLYGLPNALPGLALGETHYREPSPRRSISSFSAALALATAGAATREAGARRAKASRIWEMLETTVPETHLRRVRPLIGGESSYLRFPALLGPHAQAAWDPREAASRGVMGGYPHPLPKLPALAGRMKASGRVFPGAQELSDGLITLPTHSLLTEADLQPLAEFLRSGSF
jgi:dTDP-4-amino-4,6-dideoxygalactose transaminase